MKRLLLILAASAIAVATADAQTVQSYVYDASGNRIWMDEYFQVPMDSVVVDNQQKKLSLAKNSQPALRKKKSRPRPKPTRRAVRH